MTARAVAILSRPELAPLVDELARRMGASDRRVVNVIVRLDHAGREALAGLLGSKRLPTATARVNVANLAAHLDTDVDGLRQALETISGPVGNRAASRDAYRMSLDRAADEVADAAAALGSAAQRWARGAIRALGGPVETRRNDLLLVLGVVAERRERPQPLPVVAAAILQDPHAFDSGTRLGELLGACSAAASGNVPPAGAHAWRDALAGVGIVADELSSSVTTWSLDPGPGHPLSGSVSALAARFEPAVWTLSMLRRWPLTSAPARVLVVENPSVLAVAAAESYDGTVVCCAGRPTVATMLLLEQLASAGASVDTHADFDEVGLSITSGFAIRGYRPWRMTARAYLDGLEKAGDARDGGAVPDTPWDPSLSEVFRTNRRPLYEEMLIADILT